MSLEKLHSEQVCICENCGMRSLSSAIIAGKHFCSVLCYERWKLRKEQERARAPPMSKSGRPPREKEVEEGAI